MLSEKKMKKFNENKSIIDTVAFVMIFYFTIMLFLPLSIYDTRMDNIIIIHKESMHEKADNQNVKIINTLISNSYEDMSKFSPIKMITNRNYIMDQNEKVMQNIRSMKSINKGIKDADLKIFISKKIVEVEEIYMEGSPVDLIKRLIAAPVGIILILVLRNIFHKDLKYQLENDKQISLLIPSP